MTENKIPLVPYLTFSSGYEINKSVGIAFQFFSTMLFLFIETYGYSLLNRHITLEQRGMDVETTS